MLPTILVIEDNEINMDLVIFLLRSMDMVVLPALNGPAGLAMAKKLRPSIILCDIQMPELDGFAVLNALRGNAKFANIPVVALTALAMDGDRERMLAAGFDGYLSKPIDLEELQLEIRTQLASIASGLTYR